MVNNEQTKKDYQKSPEYDITPETRIGELLKNYPELENTLMEIAPAFKKLKNPVLRRTVAKVTTLRHAAKIGNISLASMINHLRKKAGLEKIAEAIEGNQISTKKPN